MAKPILLLVDGNSLAFRAYFALISQVNRFVSHEGLHTNALVGFNNLLDGIVEPVKPDLALVAWDKGKTTFRTGKLASYKGNRDKTPVELSEQFPYLRQLVELHGIKSYELENYEADDIIGTTARMGAEAGYQVIIVTGDRDLTQLASDDCTVWVTKKGITEIDHYDPAFVAEKFDGLLPKQIIELKGLQGDNSDNYPGVAGVGPKTALKLIKQFHSIPELYTRIDELKPSKQKEKLIAGQADAMMSRNLATIRTDIPVEYDLKDLTYRGPDYQALIPFYQRLDFKQQLVKLANQGHLAETAGEAADEALEIAREEPVEMHALSPDHFSDLKALKDSLSVYIELDDEDYHTAAPVAIVIGNEHQGYFVTRDVEELMANETFQGLMTDPTITKNVFDAKKTGIALSRFGIQVQALHYDILLMSYLLDVNDNSNDLGALAQEHGYMAVQTDEAVYGRGAKFAIPADDSVLFKHLANKARAINRLANQMIDDLKERQQLELYWDIELPLATVLAQMEMTGIKVDSQRLLAMDQDISQQLKDLEAKIYAEAGHSFNINSTQQLGTVLFEEMGYKPLKKTKTGYSTSVEVLEQMADIPIVESILDYRQLAKIKSTYITGLLKVIHGSDSKVHTHYPQTLTQTGRLSSKDPNLQNIPARLEEGRRIRQAFVPSFPDWSILSADYSQIELRVLAHMTGDKNMQAAFQSGEDIHADTARRIFDLAPDATVDPNMRRQAKAVNFGIVYGISDFGLAKNLGISRAAAKDMIERYFNQYPGVKQWLDDIVLFAREHGYVETMAHRRRYLPDIKAKNFHLRSFAERTAMNTPIQGSAADIIKIAMLRVQKALAREHLQTRMLLQVHDELIFEAPNTELELLHQLIPEIMDSAMSLDVPLKVASHEGATWYDAK
ncbi:DNA polymerase I [Weissella halotolerans]|uniref:DNA polymerase I n=1 Tax=Weissella halotolerans DSM 20190 TaxID=1123500 RepID=A0A0R2FZF2_9LACO|nr:DNA polymerase I [Weissella halotolerans]KRN33600.1 DNA polymerase I [Weissella halotolerans DSM 20190]